MALFPASGGSGTHNYSTTEQIVGKDADGSTIYEKTYYSDSVSITADTTIDASLKQNQLKRVIFLNGMTQYGGASWNGFVDLFNSGTRYTSWPAVTNSGLILYVTNRTITAYHITVQYVKL